MIFKKSVFYLVILTLSFANISSVFSFSEKVDRILEHKLTELVKKYQFPGAMVGVWIPDQGEWVHAEGLADKQTKEKLTINDHFRVGSITKTFVVTALLQLMDRGKLSLDDKITQYIEKVPNGDKITLRQLANMTSGLPNYTKNKAWLKTFLENPNYVWTPKELLAVAFSVPIQFEPGEKFEYCNTNTVLLGLVIEKVSKQSLGEFLDENIFKPLKLKNTFYPMDGTLPFPYAHGYAGLPDHSIVDDTFRDPSWSFAAGALVSTLGDLRIWAKALGTGKLISEKAFLERLSWEKVSPNTEDRHYMLGVGFDKGWLLHEGELPGYNTKIAYLPEEKAVFVCFINTDADVKVKGKRISPATVIFKDMAKILFPKNVPIG